MISREIIIFALTDVNLDNLWNDEYIKIAEILWATLDPIRITVENLSREDSALYTAEGALKFLFTNLEKVNNELTNVILVSVKEKILKRRDDNCISLEIST